MKSDTAHRNALKAGYELLWYQIKAVLGQGAFGITYLARDINLNRMVAIKEFLPGQYAMRDGEETVRAVSEELQERFQWGLGRFIEEARILDQFDHNNIVRVLNTFEANNTAYMVMRYEQGVSLKEILVRQKYLDESDLLNILFPILDGLDLMHQAGYIHRDIKPSNIFVRTDGTPVLLDFGSARQSMQIETQTLTSLVSPGYAPIEQYVSKSDKQGAWTDIYGMAATLYRAVTGVAPADAISRGEALTGNEKDTYIPCRELADQRYSDTFVEGIDQGLRFLTRERPQTVQAWKESILGKTEHGKKDPTAEEEISGHISNEVVSVVRDSLTQTATRVYASKGLSPDTSWDIDGITADQVNTDTVSVDIAHKQGFHRGLKVALGILFLLAGGFLVSNFDKVRDVEQQGFIADPEENLSLMPAIEGEAIEPRIGVSDPEQQVDVIVSDPVSVPKSMASNPDQGGRASSEKQLDSSPLLTPSVAEQALDEIVPPVAERIRDQSVQSESSSVDPEFPETEGQLLLTPRTNEESVILNPQVIVDGQIVNELGPEATVVSELPPGAILLEESVQTSPQPAAKTRSPSTRPEGRPSQGKKPSTPISSSDSNSTRSQVVVEAAPETPPTTEPQTIDNKTRTVTEDGVLIEEYDIPKRPVERTTLRSEFDKFIDFLRSTGQPESGSSEEIRTQVEGNKP